jgi:hypothetical protein
LSKQCRFVFVNDPALHEQRFGRPETSLRLVARPSSQISGLDAQIGRATRGV